MIVGLGQFGCCAIHEVCKGHNKYLAPPGTPGPGIPGIPDGIPGIPDGIPRKSS